MFVAVILIRRPPYYDPFGTEFPRELPVFWGVSRPSGIRFPDRVEPIK